ncbi:DHA2 family efflux MFS transporter permease subunit [Nocardioides alkalitolerans]|uniref:DHA2 family efflux MFS transporter permease subunit n=1 Tax=Nocardioides alkalitolerans TaxID=281714 RepID=UPI00041FD3C7|nr:DHA2 family efflux MFS transporter permease subunit [Nocardioides alkalitolerans]
MSDARGADAVDATPAEASAEVPARAWKVLAISAAGVFVVFLDATVVNIAFPALSADFPDVTRAGLSWVLNAYAVVFGALLVTAGRLADDRGRKKVFLAGLMVFAVGSALCGVAPSVELLVAARALQAVGAALLVPASLALLLPEFPAARRAGAVGLWGAAGGAAAAAGPTLGALLVEGPGWRWVFLINVPFCVLAVVAGRRVLRESTGTPTVGRQDLLGVVMVTAVFGLLSLGLVQGESWGWTSWRVVGSFVVAALLVPVLVLRALRHPSPVLPVRLFVVRTFSVATAALLLFSAAFFAVILCNVLFLTGVWEYSVLRTAVAVLPSPLLAALLSPVTGRLADRLGFRVLVVPGALAMAAGAAWLALRTGSEASYWTDFLPGTVLIGLAIAFALPTLGAAGAASLLPHQFGAGSAVGATARQLGAVVGVAVLVAVLGEPAPADALDAFHRSWLVVAATATACAVLSLGLAGRRRAH